MKREEPEECSKMSSLELDAFADQFDEEMYKNGRVEAQRLLSRQRVVPNLKNEEKE